MATRKKKNNIGAFGHPIYGKGFAKYGEMRSNGSSEIPNDLEEASQEYEKKHTYQRYDGGGLTPEYDATLAESFIAGAQWQAEQDKETIELAEDHAYLAGAVNEKEKMLNGAVECHVSTNGMGNKYLFPNYNDDFKDINDGDRVKIIIIKEDKK